ncbi:MAG: aminotransferase [Planctomycetota bacterium]
MTPPPTANLAPIRTPTAQLARQDLDHVLHPWTDFSTVGDVEPMVFVGGEGYAVEDADGQCYLDAIGGMWCVTLGHGRAELAEAMARQAKQLAFYTPFGSMTSAPAAELAAELAGLTPGDLNRVHFTTGGSTAVDSALRFAHYYWASVGQPGRKHIISRIDAYHGSTYLAASVSGKRCDRTYFQYESAFVHHLSSPNSYHREKDQSTEGFCDQLVAELEQKILELGPERVACLIAEPILASGGVIVPPPDYHRRTLEVCRRYGVLYICDEVVTGFGRLGHFFAAEPHFGIVPDIIITAKGLTSGAIPLGAFIVSDRLIDAIATKDTPANSVFTNGFTYSGHAVACAVARANIALMKQERICEHVRDVGPYFIQRLNELRRYDVVGDVRGDHLMACIVCDVGQRAPMATARDIAVAERVDAHCQQRGLLVRPYENLCILSPPLIIDRRGIDAMLDRLHASIEATEHDLKSGALQL